MLIAQDSRVIQNVNVKANHNRKIRLYHGEGIACEALVLLIKSKGTVSFSFTNIKF